MLGFTLTHVFETLMELNPDIDVNACNDIYFFHVLLDKLVAEAHEVSPHQTLKPPVLRKVDLSESFLWPVMDMVCSMQYRRPLYNFTAGINSCLKLSRFKHSLFLKIHVISFACWLNWLADAFIYSEITRSNSLTESNPVIIVAIHTVIIHFHRLSTNLVWVTVPRWSLTLCWC